MIDFKGSGDAGAPGVNGEGKLVGILWRGDDKTSFLMPAARVLKELGVELAK